VTSASASCFQICQSGSATLGFCDRASHEGGGAASIAEGQGGSRSLMGRYLASEIMYKEAERVLAPQ